MGLSRIGLSGNDCQAALGSGSRSSVMRQREENGQNCAFCSVLFFLRTAAFFFWLRVCECESAIQDTKSKVGHFLSISFLRASLGYDKCLYFKLTTI
jgi:hypothetical protein